MRRYLAESRVGVVAERGRGLARVLEGLGAATVDQAGARVPKPLS